MILPSLTSSLIRSSSRTSGASHEGVETPNELRTVTAGHPAADLESV
jgi:hypothetical protein